MTYRRLLHRRSASLDLEAAFKQIRISRDITPDVCILCKCDQCQCPAFKHEMPCSSALSTPIHCSLDSDSDQILELVPNTNTKVLYPPVVSLFNEEADQEVAEICNNLENTMATILHIQQTVPLVRQASK